jgi:hypothetical protein
MTFATATPCVTKEPQSEAARKPMANLRFRKIGINVAVEQHHGLVLVAGRLIDISKSERPGKLYGAQTIQLRYNPQVKDLDEVLADADLLKLALGSTTPNTLVEFSLHLFERPDYLAVCQSSEYPLIDNIVSRLVHLGEILDCKGREAELAISLLQNSLQLADKYEYAGDAGMSQRCLVLSQDDALPLTSVLPPDLPRTEFNELILACEEARHVG